MSKYVGGALIPGLRIDRGDRTPITMQLVVALREQILTARLPDGKSGLGDEGFCMDITKNAGVTALPFSAFYLPDPDKRASDQYVRFCFCK